MLVTGSDIIRAWERLQKQIEEIEAAIRKLGHSLDNVDEISNARKDERASVKLLLAEYERLIHLQSEFYNTEAYYELVPEIIRGL